MTKRVMQAIEEHFNNKINKAREEVDTLSSNHLKSVTEGKRQIVNDLVEKYNIAIIDLYDFEDNYSPKPNRRYRDTLSKSKQGTISLNSSCYLVDKFCEEVPTLREKINEFNALNEKKRTFMLSIDLLGKADLLAMLKEEGIV